MPRRSLEIAHIQGLPLHTGAMYFPAYWKHLALLPLASRHTPLGFGAIGGEWHVCSMFQFWTDFVQSAPNTSVFLLGHGLLKVGDGVGEDAKPNRLASPSIQVSGDY